MRVLSKEELREVNKNNIINLYALLESWIEKKWISQEESEQFKKSIKNVNFNHHNDANFEKNLIKLFTDGETINSIDRHNIGGVFVGLTSADIPTIYLESIEMGVIVLGNKEEITNENVYKWLDLYNWLVQSIKSPELGIVELQYNKLNNLLTKNQEKTKIIKV